MIFFEIFFSGRERGRWWIFCCCFFCCCCCFCWKFTSKSFIFFFHSKSYLSLSRPDIRLWNSLQSVCSSARRKKRHTRTHVGFLCCTQFCRFCHVCFVLSIIISFFFSSWALLSILFQIGAEIRIGSNNPVLAFTYYFIHHYNIL